VRNTEITYDGLNFILLTTVILKKVPKSGEVADISLRLYRLIPVVPGHGNIFWITRHVNNL